MQPIVTMTPKQAGDQELLVAIAIGDIARVAHLIAKGANANAQYKSGNTALIYSADSGNEEMVKLLLKAGAEVDTQHNGSTALIAAAKKGHKEIVKMLLDADANANRRDSNGDTALILAAGFGTQGEVSYFGHKQIGEHTIERYTEIVSLILNKANIDLNIQNKYGETALMLAAEHDHIDAVKKLLEHGANRFLKNNRKQTAIDIALETKNPEIADLIKNFKETPRSLLQLSIDKVARQVINSKDKLKEEDIKKLVPTDRHEELAKAIARFRQQQKSDPSNNPQKTFMQWLWDYVGMNKK